MSFPQGYTLRYNASFNLIGVYFEDRLVGEVRDVLNRQQIIELERDAWKDHATHFHSIIADT